MTLQELIQKQVALLPAEKQSEVLDFITFLQQRASRPVVEWPQNFFTSIIGGWQGTLLIREPQGTYEFRSELK